MPSLTKSELYDTLYQMGQDVLDKYQPCQIKAEESRTMCTEKRSHDKVYRNLFGDTVRGFQESSKHMLCCAGCKHWDRGCTVKALACKLWICMTLRERNPELERELLALRQAAGNADIPFYIRRSKEENFELEKEWGERIER